MAIVDQSGIIGKTRDRPISEKLEALLREAADIAGIERVFVTSGGQPGSGGGRVGSTRHDGGRAADLQLIDNGRTLTFSDAGGNVVVERFVSAAAALGAIGIGAGNAYMGEATLHVGFGETPSDTRKLVWGAKGRSVNAPRWLRAAAELGWNDPKTARRPVSDGADEDDREEDAPGEFSTGGGVGGSSGPLLDDDIDLMVPAGFTAEVVELAMRSQRDRGIPASVTLAQWALESSFGRRMPPGSNNPFGFKTFRKSGGSAAMTTEFENGVLVRKVQSFKIYGSLAEAFQDHARLLAEARPYERARSVMNDPDRFADALTGVYATDPAYGSKLKKIMRQFDLYRFNRLDVAAHGRDDEDAMGYRPLAKGDVDMVRVKALQEQLRAKGYEVGKIDGKFGSITAAALLAFQSDSGLSTTGVLDTATADALGASGTRPLDPERVAADEKDLAAQGSRIVLQAGRNRLLSWIAMALGGLGLGNSAAVNAVGGATTRPGTLLPDALPTFLIDVQKLTAASPATEHQRLATLAKQIGESLPHAGLSPEMAQFIDQIRRVIPVDVVARNADLQKVLDAFGKAPVARPAGGMSTILDILPTFFANDTVLQTMMKGVAAVGASTLPGFGGSLAIVAGGLLARHFSNSIAQARVEDHRKAASIGR